VRPVLIVAVAPVALVALVVTPVNIVAAVV
jgi:hypothetical protein